ncbi:putative Co/Zn/Cd efflux system membrane fusion protein [Fimbriiglobus ruber]|uniref:Putative Co/Zn/Cd efflux system membrane fusion protein n=1 Tax=Fimbriiglobus ruber TaxID=1908690 RepID=A0A225DES2_9BACT|nr:putative Co/Zn/Cd efflux system membrane fusion protein [Fimbriiglobus ruber]
MRTHRIVWVFGLAVGGGGASPDARGQAPAEPGVKPGAAGTDPLRPKVVVTSPRVTDVVVTHRYAGQILAQRHIEVRALQDGQLEPIPVKEGQAVKRGDVLFRVSPILYKARLDTELAEVRVARLEFDNLKKLAATDPPVVSQREVALSEAKLAKAQAKADLAAAELDFTTVRAPFDGLLDRLMIHEGSLVERKDVLTTLSDNSVMWVYFNVPEARYLDYMGNMDQRHEDQRTELVLANDSKFKYAASKAVTVEGRFNNGTGNIPFRADFPNPDRLLRHGQTGTVLFCRTVKNATVIPQRVTFEILDGRYVYVVGKDNEVHPRKIVVQHEVDDLFVVNKGLDVNDKIVLEGIQLISDGDRVEVEFRKPEEAARRPKTGREK